MATRHMCDRCGHECPRGGEKAYAVTLDDFGEVNVSIRTRLEWRDEQEPDVCRLCLIELLQAVINQELEIGATEADTQLPGGPPNARD